MQHNLRRQYAHALTVSHPHVPGSMTRWHRTFKLITLEIISLFMYIGKKTLLIEQFSPVHTQGSSHGDGRIIRVAYADDTYNDIVVRAYTLWHDLEKRSGTARHVQFVHTFVYRHTHVSTHRQMHASKYAHTCSYGFTGYVHSNTQARNY